MTFFFRHSAACVFFLAVALVLSAPAQAQRIAPLQQAQAQASLSDGIAAIVNESVVSLSDVRNRLKMALLSANLPDAPETRQKIAPQVLRALIDEQLQIQEGKKMDVSISADEIEEAMKHIARENKIPGGDMSMFLESHGIPVSTLRTQIKATLSWNRVVMRVLRPRVEIGEDEITAVANRMQENAGKQEYLVSEIFLAVDKPEEENEVRALAENLADQLKGGAVFGSVARQFSQSVGAASGGDIGWIQVGQLAPEVDKVLQTLQAGEIAGPIRSASGFHIVGVREKRTIAMGNIKEMTVKLEQIFKPFTEGVGKETLLEEANTIRQTISGCEDLSGRIRLNYPNWRWQDLGEIKLETAPPWLAEKVANIAEGHASEAMATARGALMLFVCKRIVPEGDVNRDAIRNAIGAERLDLLARRQLRDLRRDAFIDVRMKAVP